jgi:hypothetical protein
MKTPPAALVAFLTLLVCCAAFAQEPNSGDQAKESCGEQPAKPATPVTVTLPMHVPRAEHRFFDVKNVVAITAVGISLAGDGWSTQRALALPGTHEVNPVARPFVSTRGGEIAYSGASLALVVGGLYLAHRTHHHGWERVGPYALAGWESLLTAWNFHLAR